MTTTSQGKIWTDANPAPKVGDRFRITRIGRKGAGTVVAVGKVYAGHLAGTARVKIEVPVSQHHPSGCRWVNSTWGHVVR